MAFRYDPRHRPPQPSCPAADAFGVQYAPVAERVSLAFVREGVGGAPLLLIHGYPETKRIWWRNIGPLAEAGFEVIVPDLRGMGDSDIPADDQLDLVTYSRDLYALVHDQLGHSSCVIAASDVGGVVAVDMIHRYPGFVDAFCVFNTVAPLGVDYTGIESLSGPIESETLDPTGDYRWMQGAFPDQLAAMLTTPQARRQWVANMYTNRLWSSRYAFDQAAVDFMTEPFADEARLRAGWATYQLAYGREMAEFPLMDAVDVPTLVLYGPDDHVLGEDFVPRCERAFRNRIGPLVVPGAGHFLQWERADIFNRLLPAVFGG
ncbi:alpha/beta fold hydrolase [Mycolicibacterium arenosum]|uniref:Alpha/beta hydrolase n=1 Tax=Mycolicibacterium arenosum TaxID=2952157 RepID=A0ABT1LUQ4_9MYCO|nr:alpha/beta hydrolase [Mycolicibacterium sp. CAU 1645]MCP9270636.1 alpha/beta hydrolase [Mycolicibacterium sp. CAU 1645]